MNYRDQLLDALSNGPQKPSDLDETILGGVYWPGIAGLIPPYGGALGNLIKEGAVRWSYDDTGTVWYELEKDSL